MAVLRPNTKALLRWLACTVLVLSALFASLCGVGVLIGPTVEHFDTPHYPELLRKEFDYLKAIWATCVPLGYTLRNYDCDVYVGEADCEKFGSRDALASALRAEVFSQEKALWVGESENLFTIVWPGWGGDLIKGKLLIEDVLVIEGTKLRVITGEIVCRNTIVDHRDECYVTTLKEYLQAIPPIPVGLKCSSQEEKPETLDSMIGTPPR